MFQGTQAYHFRFLALLFSRASKLWVLEEQRVCLCLDVHSFLLSNLEF